VELERNVTFTHYADYQWNRQERRSTEDISYCALIYSSVTLVSVRGASQQTASR